MDKDELIKKIKTLKDLRDAIKMIKASQQPENVEKSDNPANKDYNNILIGDLKYLGRKKLSGSNLIHMIGTKDIHMPYYEMTVDMSKHHRKEPSISLSYVAPNGKIVSQHNQIFSNISDAVKEMNNHHLKKKWTNG